MKKITTFFAVLAFASVSSVAMACDSAPSCGDKDKGDTGITGSAYFDVAGSGCGGSCGDRKNP